MFDDESIAKPIVNYFSLRGWKIFDFQCTAWKAFREGESGLIHSPTGSGKTLAAWFAAVNHYLLEIRNPDATLEPPSLTVLWITPLRALATDTETSLRNTIEALKLPWTLECRTGDTSASTKARQRKKLPSALITTPESLSLLLSYPESAAQLRAVNSVIVDEWHELLSTKRGVQLELCLSFIRDHNPSLRVWGLSATLGNTEQALEVLMGKRRGSARLVAGGEKKMTAIKSITPNTIQNFPWAGRTGTRLVDKVIETIASAGSTLLFVNTRSQAEIWFELLLQKKPEWLESIGLHHGSLEKRVRDYAESGLRGGRLRCVVCTSSLDLGVDFHPVEQVIQVGSPKGVARLLQRAGRSGHQPGRKSEVLCVPTHAFELVEIAAARHAAERNTIESRRPLTLCLDVLVQHCVTLALSGHLWEKKTFNQVRKSYAFSGLQLEQWRWVLDFITRGGNALQHYSQYQRVIKTGRKFSVDDKKIARLHRSAVGTITSDSAMRVKFLKGGTLGSIEESFISRLKRNDAFLFNGRVLTLIQVKDMTAYVKLAQKKTRIVPRWQGGRLPLSTELADAVRELLNPKAEHSHHPELEKIQSIRKIQSKWSYLPGQKELLIESVRTREGYHLFVYPFAGRLVHEGLATLLAYRMSLRQPITCTTSANDYGFELLSRKSFECSVTEIREILSMENLERDILQSINESELAKRQFRDIARIAGLVIQGYPGNQKSTRQIQASSGLIYDVLNNYDRDNLLLDQALSEVLEEQIEIQRLRDALERVTQQELVLVSLVKLTPMAFPLWAERLRGQIISSEQWHERVEAMMEKLDKTAAQGSRATVEIEREKTSTLLD